MDSQSSIAQRIAGRTSDLAVAGSIFTAMDTFKREFKSESTANGRPGGSVGLRSHLRLADGDGL
ncbi:hypothetical protein [Salinirarus marinus]|uniref:hypothetical protein n=1 Tax=Salinirarus marinus TaxID=3068310 RepID=UPI003C6C0AF1